MPGSTVHVTNLPPPAGDVRETQNDFSLIIAHLLGGTAGLNLNQSISQEEIEDMVGAAVRVAKEIKRQVKELEQ